MVVNVCFCSCAFLFVTTVPFGVLDRRQLGLFLFFFSSSFWSLSRLSLPCSFVSGGGVDEFIFFFSFVSVFPKVGAFWCLSSSWYVFCLFSTYVVVLFLSLFYFLSTRISAFCCLFLCYTAFFLSTVFVAVFIYVKRCYYCLGHGCFIVVSARGEFPSGPHKTQRPMPSALSRRLNIVLPRSPPACTNSAPAVVAGDSSSSWCWCSFYCLIAFGWHHWKKSANGNDSFLHGLRGFRRHTKSKQRAAKQGPLRLPVVAPSNK